jgi:hypothetical protein
MRQFSPRFLADKYFVTARLDNFAASFFGGHGFAQFLQKLAQSALIFFVLLFLGGKAAFNLRPPPENR